MYMHMYMPTAYSVMSIFSSTSDVDGQGRLAKLTETLRCANAGTCVVTVNRQLLETDEFRLVGAYRGPNPESSAGLPSTAYVYERQ